MLTAEPEPEPNHPFIIFAIIALIILVIFSAFFSMTETAYNCYNRLRIENLARKKKSRTARLTMKLSAHYDRVLSTILIGNNLTNIAATAIATVLFTMFFDDMGPTVATIVLTLVILIFGEVSPKSIAREKPEAIALFAAYPLAFFYYLFYPVSFVLSGIQVLFKKMLHVEDDEPELTEEEFRMLVDDIHEDGVLNEIETDIIQKTLEYGDTLVKDIMTRAKNVVFVKDTDSIKKITNVFVDSNYSRVPVAKKDNINTVYGILYQKDFYEMMIKEDVKLKDIIRTDPIYTKPGIKISRLLKKLQSEKQHMAFVRDKYNRILGVVTMEDILEELVGEIEDEYDAEDEEKEKVG